MKLTERKLKILQEIIREYVQNAEPVGSRTLSKKPGLDYSPATIRNEMSDLEEMGFLTHPHTSAGRMPSDKGYRLYVNHLMTKEELTLADKQAIAHELQADMNEFDQTIKKAAKILSRITNLTSFAMSPTKEEETLKFVNFLPVNDKTVVMMIVSESGEVSNTALSLKAPCSNENLQILAKSMTYSYQGMKLTDVLKSDMIKSFETNVEALGRLASDIMPDFLKTLEDMLDVQLYMTGLSNIFDLPEYNNIESARSFLNLVEQKDSLIELLSSREDGLIVTIGEENMDEQFKDCSMITATYSVDGKTVGKIGVIGPKRMRYGKVTSIVEYLTDNLNKSFRMDIDDEDREE
jgi:heat-inducible transcriptional repressor